MKIPFIAPLYDLRVGDSAAGLDAVVQVTKPEHVSIIYSENVRSSKKLPKTNIVSQGSRLAIRRKIPRARNILKPQIP